MMVAYVAVLAGVAAGFRGFPGVIDGSRREPLGPQVAGTFAKPSVLDWGRYYPYLQETTAPPIDLPADVVEDLERLLPPLKVMIADPAHSYALPVMLNQYIANPGHVISTNLDYFDRYARVDARGVRRHPIFNDSETLTAEERRFLEEFGVEYILVNPAYRDRVPRKLAAEREAFEQVYDRQGFTLYRYRRRP